MDIIGYLRSNENANAIAHFFSCKIKRGILQLGGEELRRCCPENFYEIRKININDLENIDVLGKNMIVRAYTSQFDNSVFLK